MKKNSRARQDWRTFISEVETCSSSQVLKINQEISSAYEITAFVSSLEKRGITPLFIFENVKGSSIPVVTNLLGSRTRVAIALGVPNERLHSEYSRRVSTPIPVRKVKKSAAHFRILEGSQIDISEFPVLTHFKDDPAPYITAGLMVAKDPDTGVTTMGYHRLMVKDKNRFGISFHSRKRMWDYARRCEERGQNLPVTCTMGVHPLLSMASIGVFPNHIDKFEIAGGLFGESLEVIEGINSPNLVPVHAEIVMEGEVLAGVREPEGPFGEFTDYSAHRSTQHVFVAHTLYHRQNPLFQSIAGGLSAEHCLLMAIPKETDLLQALSRTVPGVKAVNIPLSGCGLFHAYISIKKTAEGQGKQAILTALGLDHCLKLVVVVDEDVDVYNETEVLWAVSTRFQADRDLLRVEGTMGVILDPSASEQGVTARLGMDATKPLNEQATRLQVPEEAKSFAVRLSEEILEQVKKRS